jgi:hypothetical protein
MPLDLYGFSAMPGFFFLRIKNLSEFWKFFLILISV